MCCCNEVSAYTENLLVLLRKLTSNHFILSHCLPSLWNRDQWTRGFSEGFNSFEKKIKKSFILFSVHLPYMGEGLSSLPTYIDFPNSLTPLLSKDTMHFSQAVKPNNQNPTPWFALTWNSHRKTTWHTKLDSAETAEAKLTLQSVQKRFTEPSSNSECCFLLYLGHPWYDNGAFLSRRLQLLLCRLAQLPNGSFCHRVGAIQYQQLWKERIISEGRRKKQEKTEQRQAGFVLNLKFTEMA